MRLGRIGYINCYPIYGAIDRGIVDAGADLVTGTPSELNGLLAAGELDVSVVSAVEYARNIGAYQLLPDLAISCDGPVRSVALFSRCDARDLEGATVLTSASSRTSVHLLELLCSDVWKVNPAFVVARTEVPDIDALAELPHDAVLVIGDAALLLVARNIYSYRYDLGQVWMDWTGLPFVFAVWAARRAGTRRKYADEVLRIHRALIESREWGLKNIEALALEAASNTGIPLHDCRLYLSGLDYALSGRHLEGLTSFFRRLAARGTVPEGTLSFLSVA